jgi:hypothetical protein
MGGDRRRSPRSAVVSQVELFALWLRTLPYRILPHITAYGHSHIQDTPQYRNECDQWTLVRDGDDQEDFVIHEHIVFGALLSGEPYARLIRRMTVGEFLITDQPAAVKRKLQIVLEERKTARH